MTTVKVRFDAEVTLADNGDRAAIPETLDYASLAQAVQSYVQVFCEDTGSCGVPPATAILGSPGAGLGEKIGAIRALDSMVPEPFVSFPTVPVMVE